MRRIIIFTFIIVFLASACATTPRALPEKYNLDNYLEALDQISPVKIRSYENIDNQSIILRAHLNDYYLLVLRRPIDIKYTNSLIGISNTTVKDMAYSAQQIISEIRNSGTHGHPGTDFVQAPSNIGTIIAGCDKIVVRESVDNQYYVIDKIYKLKGKEQAEEIKWWLRNN